MMLKHLPQDQFLRMPWKNGGGETIEIAAFPEGASLDDFLWRVSMAQVAATGPFSIFPGIERTLSVLEGDGIDLDFTGRGLVRLEGESAPYTFPADIPVGGIVSGAGITDLNVMSRRGKARHFVSRLSLSETRRLALCAEKTMLIARAAPCFLTQGPEVLHLAAGDAVLATGAAELTLTPQGTLDLFLIEFWL